MLVLTASEKLFLTSKGFSHIRQHIMIKKGKGAAVCTDRHGEDGQEKVNSQSLVSLTDWIRERDPKPGEDEKG